MKSKRKTLGWAGFGAACVWLYYDYASVKNPQKLSYAIASGWVTIGATLAHIFV